MRVLLTIGCVLVAAAAAAQEPSFEALGQAPVVGGDRVRARERALDEALRQAVEQAVGTVLDPSQVVARSSELRLRVYPKAKSYVDNYRVLDEGETSGVFQVHLSAQVATSRLSRDLAAPAPTVAPAPSRKLRAVVCARAQGTPAPVPTPSVERLLRELVSARGVEPLPASSCVEDAAARAAQAGAAQGALVAAVETAAEGPIRGTTLAAARARVTLRLVEPDGRVSAEQAAEREAYDAAPDRAADAAARAAAEEAARALQPALAARWSESTTTGGVGVRLLGASRYADYTAVTRALAALPGVAVVEPRRFARGEADLVVRTASSAAQLSAALERMPPQGVRVEAAAEGDGGLRLQVAAAPADGG